MSIYEDLRGNLKLLRDNVKRQGKIKREDNDNDILLYYQGFFTNNELFMIDIYNELGAYKVIIYSRFETDPSNPDVIVGNDYSII